MDIELSDIHCHCLPGVDDGPANMAGAVALCRQLRAEGVRKVAATPHMLGRYTDAGRVGVIRERLAALRGQLAAEQIDLAVVEGADVRVDGTLAERIASGEVLTLADARQWVLVEMPEDTWVDISPVLGVMAKRGIRGVFTHPERYEWPQGLCTKMLQWRRQFGMVVQITAGSLMGRFGARAYERAWRWLSTGVADVIASDAHDCERRPPLMEAAWREVCMKLGEAVARRTMVTLPGKILAGPVGAVDAAVAGRGAA